MSTHCIYGSSIMSRADSRTGTLVNYSQLNAVSLIFAQAGFIDWLVDLLSRVRFFSNDCLSRIAVGRLEGTANHIPKCILKIPSPRTPANATTTLTLTLKRRYLPLPFYDKKICGSAFPGRQISPGRDNKPPTLNEDAQGHPLRQQLTASIFDKL